MLAANLPDQRGQRLTSVDHRVIVELVQIRTRRPRDQPLTFWSDLVAMIHTPCIIREIASTVSHAKLEVGMALQHAAKDQAGNRHGRFQWLTDDISQVVLPKPSSIGEAYRMHEDQRIEFFDFSKELLETGIVEIYSVDIGGDLNRPQAQLSHYPF